MNTQGQNHLTHTRLDWQEDGRVRKLEYRALILFAVVQTADIARVILDLHSHARWSCETSSESVRVESAQYLYSLLLLLMSLSFSQLCPCVVSDSLLLVENYSQSVVDNTNNTN